MQDRSRYVVLSADGHAGADLRGYRPYLESALLEEFDRWADAYVSPFSDLERPDAEVEAVRAGIDAIPESTTSFAFGPRTLGVAWTMRDEKPRLERAGNA